MRAILVLAQVGHRNAHDVIPNGAVATVTLLQLNPFATIGIQVVLGVVLWHIPVTGIITLGAAIAGYAVAYLPLAYIIDKKVR